MNRSLENTKVKLEPQDSQPPGKRVLIPNVDPLFLLVILTLENPPPPEDKSYIVVGWIGLHDDMGASILGKDAIMEGTLRAEPSNELRQTVTYFKWKGNCYPGKILFDGSVVTFFLRGGEAFLHNFV